MNEQSIADYEDLVFKWSPEENDDEQPKTVRYVDDIDGSSA